MPESVQLPNELIRKLLADAGFFKNILEPFKTDLRCPEVMDHNVWKQYFFSLFPGIKIHQSPAKTSSMDEEKHFFKGMIQKVGACLVDSIQQTELKKICKALFRNDINAVQEVLNQPQFQPLDLLKWSTPIKTNEFLLPAFSLASLADFLGRKEIVDAFYLRATHKKPESLVWWASALNQPERLSHIVEADWDGYVLNCSPLWIACEQGHPEVVHRLIAQGANANKVHLSKGVAPLWIASRNGHATIVKALLASNANAYLTSTVDGTTPIYHACYNNDEDVLKEFLANSDIIINQHCIGFNATPLWVACQANHLAIVNQLILKGADVDKSNMDDGSTPLHIAIEQGNGDVGSALIAAGAKG